MKPATPQTKTAREMQAILLSLKPGKAAKIELEDGESMRGIKAAATRIAKRLGLKIQTSDDGSAVYVSLDGKA